MSKKLGLLLAIALLIVFAAPVFAQGAFSDVPSGHWAYQAVDTLSKAGLIEGYPDGQFKGDRQMTRYEFAMAIARMMQSPAFVGKVGPVGPVGPQGPAGVGGNLTPEQQALLDKLKNEFAPELKKLDERLTDLEGRVADIEAALKRKPKVSVSGSADFRTGLYGTKLTFGGKKTTGYPNPGIVGFEFDGNVNESIGGYGEFFDGDLPWGAIHVPVTDGMGGWDYVDGASIPISDTLKDSFKTPQFTSLQTRVNIKADLSPVLSAGIGLLSSPLTNMEWNENDYGSPTFFQPNGMMDLVQVDEAWMKYSGKFIRPVNVTAGKLYAGFGRGLLFNNSQFPLKAGRLDVALTGDAPGDGITYTFFGGTVDLEGLAGQDAGFPESPKPFSFNNQQGPDVYTVQHLAIPIGSWQIGGTYLGTGFGNERRWSVDASGRLCGVDLWGEWSKLKNWPSSDPDTDAMNTVWMDDFHNNIAWIVGAGIDKPTWDLRAQYGLVGPTYAFSDEFSFNPIAQDWYAESFGWENLPLSLLHPREEFDPHYVNWADRPLFLDPTNIAKGWEVAGSLKSLLGEKTPVSFRYYAGKAYSEKYLGWIFNDGGYENSKPGKWRDGDTVWTVTVGHHFTPDFTANLTYGQRQVDNVLSPNNPQLTQGEVQDDPIKLLRLDLNIAF